jgi:ammonium transporter, Amt family
VPLRSNPNSASFFFLNSTQQQMLGTFILWFGWYGFNAGSALLSRTSSSMADVAALAAVNTTLAGGTAGIAALFLNLIVLERITGEPFFDVKYAMNGALCGLVSITAGCGVVEPWAAVVTGAVAGCLYLVGSRGLVKLRLDDAVDAIPVRISSYDKCWKFYMGAFIPLLLRIAYYWL